MTSRREFIHGSLALAAALGAISRTSFGATVPSVADDAVLALARAYSAVRYFYPGDAVEQQAWDRFLFGGVLKARAVQHPSEIGPFIEMMFKPVAPKFEVGDRAFTPGPRQVQASDVQWHHEGLAIDETLHGRGYRSFRLNRSGAEPVEPAKGPADAVFALAGGWHARMPIALPTEEAKLGAKVQDQDLPSWPISLQDLSYPQVIALGIAMWAIAKQFYPYWDVVAIEWDAALVQWVRETPSGTLSRLAVRDRLRKLGALLQDGHTFIADLYTPRVARTLPIDVRPMGEGYVVTSSTVPDLVKPGDEIIAIDGRPIASVRRELETMVSAGPHARAWQARSLLLWGLEKDVVRLRLRGSVGERDVSVGRLSTMPPHTSRPVDGEIRPGVQYIDLTRFSKGAFKDSLPRLEKARAIVFDLRGYPSRDAIDLAPFWLARDNDTPWLSVPVRSRPFAPPQGFTHAGWDLKADTRLARPRKILLIDPSVVSFGESMTSYFVSFAKGTTIGEPTFGANGDMLRFDLPSGYSFSFTGRLMRTFGGNLIHTKGFQPDIFVTPTVEGIRAGRDEILEKAIEVAQRGA